MLLSAGKIRFETLRTLAHGSISGNYALVGSLFSHPVRMLKIWNDTDANILISYNGTDTHDFIPAKSGNIYDYASNKVSPVGQLEQSAQEGVWVKQETAGPTNGNVCVTVIYAANH